MNVKDDQNLIPDAFLVRLKNKGIRIFLIEQNRVQDSLISIPSDYPDFKTFDFNEILFTRMHGLSDLKTFSESRSTLNLQKIQTIKIDYLGNENNTIDDLIRNKGLEGLTEKVCDIMEEKYPQTIMPGGLHYTEPRLKYLS